MSKFFRKDLPLYIILIMFGYSLRGILPSRSDKSSADNKYMIACLDGQISIMEAIQGKNFMACEQLMDIRKAK